MVVVEVWVCGEIGICFIFGWIINVILIEYVMYVLVKDCWVEVEFWLYVGEEFGFDYDFVM